MSPSLLRSSSSRTASGRSPRPAWRASTPPSATASAVTSSSCSSTTRRRTTRRPVRARGRDRATVLALPENRNFAGGYNAGAGAATGEILVLLNNDTIVPAGALERARRPGARRRGRPRRAAASSTPTARSSTAASAGARSTRRASPRSISSTTRPREIPAAAGIYDLDSVTGACVAVRARGVRSSSAASTRASSTAGRTSTCACACARRACGSSTAATSSIVHAEGQTSGGHYGGDDNVMRFEQRWLALARRRGRAASPSLFDARFSTVEDPGHRPAAPSDGRATSARHRADHRPVARRRAEARALLAAARARPGCSPPRATSRRCGCARACRRRGRRPRSTPRSSAAIAPWAAHPRRRRPARRRRPPARRCASPAPPAVRRSTPATPSSPPTQRPRDAAVAAGADRRSRRASLAPVVAPSSRRRRRRRACSSLLPAHDIDALRAPSLERARARARAAHRSCPPAADPRIDGAGRPARRRPARARSRLRGALRRARRPLRRRRLRRPARHASAAARSSPPRPARRRSCSTAAPPPRSSARTRHGLATTCRSPSRPRSPPVRPRRPSPPPSARACDPAAVAAEAVDALMADARRGRTPRRPRGASSFVAPAPPTHDRDSGSLRLFRLPPGPARRGPRTSRSSRTACTASSATSTTSSGSASRSTRAMPDVAAILAERELRPRRAHAVRDRPRRYTDDDPRRVARGRAILVDTVDLHHVREQRAAELGRRPRGARAGRDAPAGASARPTAAPTALIAVSEDERAALETFAPGVPVGVVSNIHGAEPTGGGFDGARGPRLRRRLRPPAERRRRAAGSCSDVLPHVRRAAARRARCASSARTRRAEIRALGRRRRRGHRLGAGDDAVPPARPRVDRPAALRRRRQGQGRRGARARPAGRHDLDRRRGHGPRRRRRRARRRRRRGVRRRGRPRAQRRRSCGSACATAGAPRSLDRFGPGPRRRRAGTTSLDRVRDAARRSSPCRRRRRRRDARPSCARTSRRSRADDPVSLVLGLPQPSQATYSDVATAIADLGHDPSQIPDIAICDARNVAATQAWHVAFGQTGSRARTVPADDPHAFRTALAA